jgi:bifunctional UDP-N-acetylglucosamine pyrophosphorylase/glucosamine-1-phosphate N-acetyltransferase
MKSRINVVILAAGLGTRMKSKHAKVLHRAGGLTLVEHVVNAATGLTTPEHVTVVVGSQAEQVKASLAHAGVQFVEQKEQKGTGHALLMCRDALASQGGLVLVTYGDGPLLSRATLQQLVDRQASSDGAATLITTRLDDPTGYGRIIHGKDGEVQAIVEQKAATPQQLAIPLINSGIYCFRADLLWKHISEIGTNNAAREYYLTDIVEILNRAGHKVAALEVSDSQELLGINTRAELAVVDKIFRERKVRELMREGVTIEKPETVTIDGGVRIGADSIVGPFAQILGQTEIGEDCRIGACSIVENSKLADRVQVAPFTSVADSHIEAEAKIGPFAHLHDGDRVGASAPGIKKGGRPSEKNK